MEEEGQKIIKLNIGNLAVFGLEPPDEIVQDMIRNLANAAGYTDSKGLFAPRKSIVHYTQEKQIAGVTVDDVYLGNGASELITMSLNALLDDGDEVLVPAPDYPLWTASVSLSGGRPVHYLCDEQSDWCPDIADIRAKVTPNTKAIVVIKEAQRGKVSEQEIIDWAHANMAAYKSPRIVEFVETLPKSATGKVMWRALQEKEAASAA